MASSVPRKQLPVHGLRAADEPHRGHAVALGIDGTMRRFTHRGVIGEPEIVIGAQVDDVALAGANDPALRAAEYALAFVKSGYSQAGKILAQTL